MEAVAMVGVEWGIASRARDGQASSGDLHAVAPFPDGVLLAAVDGLGHGEAAAAAARAATAILEAQPQDPVAALVRRCHAALLATRGVVMSVASLRLSLGLLTWVGVGNVQGLLLRGPGGAPAESELLLRGGVVGAQLPLLLTSVLPAAAGDTLVFTTDGVAPGFDRGLARNRAPQRAADAILAGYGRRTDDALVLVARVHGGRP